MIRNLVRRYRNAAREKRRRVFLERFPITSETKILDLGSEDGASIVKIINGLPYNPANVFIADINPQALEKGNKTYGFTPVLIDENAPLEFEDKFFDIVYCSSVIEHVTVPKRAIYDYRSNREFRKVAYDRQRQFAAEIARLGKGYFVQTPNRWFVFEAHTWLPFVGWLPRSLQMDAILFFNRFWIKKTQPDFSLLDRSGFFALFPDSVLIAERSFGLVKSWMAIKRLAPDV